MEKILSIIIPSYNSSPYLEKCLESLIRSDAAPKLEIIVVNDGSTDGCEKIAEQYVNRYPGIVFLINKENGGHGSAINKGSEKASAKYMKVLDADDWFLTENLGHFTEALEKTDADVVLTPHHTIDISTGEKKNWRMFPDEFGKEYTMGEIMADWKKFDRSLTFHGITYRTQFYKENGIQLLEKVFYEDHQYATYPCCKAKSLLPLDIFIYEYRIGDVSQSVSAENQLKRISHTEAVIKAMSSEKKNISGSDAISYCTKKTHLLFLSFLVTALLCSKNRKSGRELAKKMADWLLLNDKDVYDMSAKHYSILLKMNRLHISLKTYNKMLNSKLYNKARHNKSFD